MANFSRLTSQVSGLKFQVLVSKRSAIQTAVSTVHRQGSNTLKHVTPRREAAKTGGA